MDADSFQVHKQHQGPMLGLRPHHPKHDMPCSHQERIKSQQFLISDILAAKKLKTKTPVTAIGYRMSNPSETISFHHKDSICKLQRKH
uniref:Putative ovule protein n=1 Tax=Solanum chacoense TaxID=4108 RepID=A0A0V0I0U6_SOLCH